MRELGFWGDMTISDYFAAAVARSPDRLAVVEHRVASANRTALTYADLSDRVDRIASAFMRLGVGPGDVVSIQLPNSWQFTTLYLACSRIGAVLNPLMPIFRERELSFMLAHSESKIVIVPKRFRGTDYEPMLNALKPQLPALRHVIVIDGGGADNSFETLLSGPQWEAAPDAREILARHRPGPDDVTQLLYTSGTTGEPKGVMHTANTLFSNIEPYAQAMRLGCDDVVLMASPMAHQTGFMYGLMMPLLLRAQAVLQDVWQPQAALELIAGEGVTFTMASTAFLADLVNAVKESGTSVPTLRTFLCAGAPIPGALVERARETLGAKIVSAWGMTEMGAVTLTRLDDDDKRSVTTDGTPLPGVEARVVDENGEALPPGMAGRLFVRACSAFGGYLKRAHLNATDADGWFDTGDLAHIDSQGYIRISGRSKDVIIRGGENIPVVEIEALLYRHPAISQVAIVAWPDARLGERACAMVVPTPGETVDLPALTAFLKAQGMATQYWPERLVLLDAMPVTPAGKIQKFKLRDLLKEINDQ